MSDFTLQGEGCNEKAFFLDDLIEDGFDPTIFHEGTFDLEFDLLCPVQQPHYDMSFLFVDVLPELDIKTREIEIS